jgi:hypothetical protein
LGRVKSITRARRAVRLAAALASTLALGGCGGIEFQGKVFDYMGISGDRGPQEDVRMAERPPLLLPPNPKTLPPPGSGVAAATARADWPTNPEVVSKNIAAAKKAEEAKKEAAAEPGNPYAGKPSLFDKVFDKFGKSKTDEPPVADVPEPDPSDKRPDDNTVAAANPKPLAPRVPEEITPAPAEDPFHPSAPDSYKGVSSGSDASQY